MEGIDGSGLDGLDRRSLHALASHVGGRPTGLNTLASTLQQDTGTLQDVVEPWLLHCGYITTGPSGRRITPLGLAALDGLS